ncbi:hypothetical protein M408DRAFT_229474 [Serendipita vermifera MAFF 305830]|uniref:Uncharacterized protein n=1 Tax=Serendipita vermifera MAFF 305830 TaxID=933852 RepID=A0A0C2WED5_SERVB|nr:hypothetical protein M408DRAFT_229474 [Serendipita vermifera MAFF 305830]
MHERSFSPFVAFSEGSPSLEDIATATTNATGSLDPLGISSIGNLCWNKSINSIGLVSGTVEDETIPILRRLVTSYLTDTTSKVLILHTDHSAVFGGSCSLLASSWPPPRVLVSPQAPESVFSTCQTFNASVTPISFPDTSLTLRHVLAIFTPPHDMPGSSTVLGAVQYILSQLQEPFDLQRFGELVDGEKWSEEAATFIALRQTLLTKLLSPAGVEDPEDMARQITLVDLTDPVLNSTRLDSVIMDIAVHDFLRHTAERKMIVFNNCQQYLTATSALRRTIESLATAGSGRTASVILSTTDPTAISASPSFLHSLQYVLFGSSYSILHDGFLDRHLPRLSIPREQCGFRRAVLWSPGSTLYLPKNEMPVKKSWNDLVSFIDVTQFEDSMPTAAFSSDTHNKIRDGYQPNYAELSQQTTRFDSSDGGEKSTSLSTPVPSNNDLSFPAPSDEPLSQVYFTHVCLLDGL